METAGSISYYGLAGGFARVRRFPLPAAAIIGWIEAGQRAASLKMRSGDHVVHAFVEEGPRLKTQGEVEATVCDSMTRFMQEFMGRGPKEIRAHLIGDLLIVRLKGILSAGETSLAAVLPAEKGRDLLKGVRKHLIEASRDRFEQMIEISCGTLCVSMHHDVSTVTGEEVFVFTLHTPPALRPVKGNR
jgi:uncharacterized protein YbcI